MNDTEVNIKLCIVFSSSTPGQLRVGSENPKIPRIKPEISGLGPAGLRFLAFRAHGTGPGELYINMAFLGLPFGRPESMNSTVFTFNYALTFSNWCHCLCGVPALARKPVSRLFLSASFAAATPYTNATAAAAATTAPTPNN